MPYYADAIIYNKLSAFITSIHGSLRANRQQSPKVQLNEPFAAMQNASPLYCITMDLYNLCPW